MCSANIPRARLRNRGGWIHILMGSEVFLCRRNVWVCPSKIKTRNSSLTGTPPTQRFCIRFIPWVCSVSPNPTRLSITAEAKTKNRDQKSIAGGSHRLCSLPPPPTWAPLHLNTYMRPRIFCEMWLSAVSTSGAVRINLRRATGVLVCAENTAPGEAEVGLASKIYARMATEVAPPFFIGPRS